MSLHTAVFCYMYVFFIIVFRIVGANVVGGHLIIILLSSLSVLVVTPNRVPKNVTKMILLKLWDFSKPI